jgi:hypothetical protein
MRLVSEQPRRKYRKECPLMELQHGTAFSTRRGACRGQGLPTAGGSCRSEPESCPVNALGGGGVVFSIGGLLRRHLSSAG